MNWSSTDVVCIAHTDDPDGKVILWIGVGPRAVPFPSPTTSASMWLSDASGFYSTTVSRMLKSNCVSRTSSKRPVTYPLLLEPTDIIDPTAILREPFTTSLGITICAENMPWAEGTAGFFLGVPSVNKLFLVTARHVLFPRSKNEPFECTDESQARHNVLVLSETSFIPAAAHLY